MQNIYQAKGATLIEQYRDTGKLFAKTIKQSVQKLAKSKTKLLQIRKQVAEKVWENLRHKKECNEFALCFEAWAEGAGITPKQAMWLMADNLSGCQTVVVRYKSGVALLHTEEEFRDKNHMELHMTSPHTISFRENGEVSHSLVYNNLFPGAGLYGWKKDLIVAVDSIFLKENEILQVEKPVLANVIAWMVWRMKPSEADPDKIVDLLKHLGTLIDGYVINVVRQVDGEVQGYKLILARDETKIVYVGGKSGNYLKQVNIIDREDMATGWALPPRNIWRGGWKYFTNRLKALDKQAKEYGKWCHKSLTSEQVSPLHHQIQQTVYGELSENYVHPDLGAMCVGFVDISIGTSVSCKLNDSQDLGVIEYLDWMR